MKRRKRLDVTELWEFALRSMGARAQSLGEVRAKLRERAERPEDVEATLTKLREYGLIDDARFAEGFAEARLSNQGFGRMRALRDLRQRRVEPGLAEQVVTRVYGGRDETGLIEEFIRRKYRAANRGSLFQSEKDLAAAFRRLRVAGFGSENVIRTLKRFAARPELLDGIEADAGDEEDT